MRSRLRFLVLLPLTSLLACGGATSPPIGNAFNPVGGDYVITVAPGTANAGTFTGALTVAGSTASGVFRYNNPSACAASTQDITFSGSTSNGVLILTSAPFSSSVATLSIQLPLSNNNIGQQLASGTAVITGGTCALASSSLQAQLIPSFNGGWSISIISPAAATYSLAITQMAADSDGQFPTTAVLNCGSGAPYSLTGLVSGQTLLLSTSAPQAAVSVTANNSSTPVGVTIGGACSGNGTMAE
jgi:hypothetical protein